MPSSCNGWCGSSAPDGHERCAGCQSLQEPFFGLHHSQRPDSKQREHSSSIFDPARGLSPEQKMLSLAGAFPESNLPPGFRSSRGPNGVSSQGFSGIWKSALESFRIYGYLPRGLYSLPDCLLEIDHQDRISIDGIRLEGPLPMLDICEWLANPDRVTAIRSWKHFLLALSCCCRSISAI